jgi:hypothetical protein
VGRKGGNAMQTVRRILVALGSLATLAIAGGAHWKVP